MAEPADAVVRDRLARLDGLLGQVEQIPGPAGELVLEAVSALADVYGEALRRATAYASAAPAVVEAITADELLGHLLVLHGIHPDPVERRVGRTLDDLRPALQQQGGNVELAGIDDGVATIRLSVSGCGSTRGAMEEAVRDAVLAIAPELSDVRSARASGRGAAFVPVEALLRPPVGSGAGP